MSKLDTSYLFALFLIAFSFSVKGQMHNNFWTRGIVGVEIAKNLKLDNEFQHRRQNGFENNNPFDKNLMFTYRTWLHYQKSARLKFSLSPFSYYANYNIILDEQGLKQSRNEFRFAGAIEMNQPITQKLKVFQRVAAEYHLGLNHNQNRMRVRTRLGLSYDATHALFVSLYDELLVNTFGITPDHIFDHNRIGLSLAYKVMPSLTIETGYLFINRLLLLKPTMVYENNMFVNINYTIF